MQTPSAKHEFPRSFPRSPRYAVRINGVEHDVLQATGADFVIAPFSDAAQVEVKVLDGLSTKKSKRYDRAIEIRPLKLAIGHEVDGDSLRFELGSPANIYVDIPGAVPLYLFVNQADENMPDRTDEKVYFFEAGQTYEIGSFELNSGETVYIEAGAVVKGAFWSDGADNITIAGQGILDNSYFGAADSCHPIHLKRGKGVTIRGITMIEPTRWTCVLRDCEQVEVDQLKQITVGGGRDGIDVVSSRHVHIHDCFLRSGDDCIVIKANDHDREKNIMLDGKDCYDILVERCSLLNDGGGNALEIGHELRTDEVRDMTFRDCDILHVHGMGAAFSINNGAWCTVRDILFEDIRVEHFYDNLFWLRVIKSRYSHTERRGQVRNITFRNISVHESHLNPGYSISVIGGYDPEHTVEGIHFENFTMNGRKILNLHDFDCYVRDVSDITFR